jgi:hypothetical protein
VAIDVYNGVYNDDTAWVFDERFTAARWREAVEENAESRGVAVIVGKQQYMLHVVLK